VPPAQPRPPIGHFDGGLPRTDGSVAAALRRWTRALGEVVDRGDLPGNLHENALPLTLGEVTAATYLAFLAARRKLMAAKIREYYERL
jgi:hypothetical protein